MEKEFGHLKVVKSGKHGYGIVEVLYFGCVICAWYVEEVDRENFPVIRSIYDRVVRMDFDKDDFWKAVKWGQKLAEVLV